MSQTFLLICATQVKGKYMVIKNPNTHLPGSIIIWASVFATDPNSMKAANTTDEKSTLGFII